MSYLGEIAAIVTSIAWSTTSILFTLSSKKIGSVAANQIRLLIAVVLSLLTHYLITGFLLPVNAGPERWFWMSLSGIFGYVAADGILFQSFINIGTRMTMLLFSTSPIFSAILARILFHEVLSFQEIVAMLVVFLGVTLVVVDNQNNGDDSNKKKDGKKLWMGLLLGTLAALGQSVGQIFSKIGLVGGFPALSGNVIRLIAAVIVIWLPDILRGKLPDLVQRVRENQSALLTVSGGAITGPFIGVWLSLIAIQNAPMGIASTLMGLAPVILLPVGRIFFKEQFGWKAVIGTLVAVFGTVIFFI